MTLGRYELIDRIAVGGMAEIYLARAKGIEGFEKLVVLKRILPQFSSNKEFVSMFLDEARLSATLQHTNIAQVHDIGQHGHSYFFTMEYIRGEDVRAILKTALQARKRVPLSCSLAIVAGAAAGLHAAHVKCGADGTPLQIVHRDVSPSNVLVSYDGGVKLVDFGVAKAAQRQHETQAGTLKGKVAYMSPEQCRGKQLDRRSDIFALGILLYELTTHRRLFKGESEFEIMNKIVKEDVEPPSITYGKYPADLERILLKALQRDRDQRYASAQELQVDIEEFARKHAIALSTVKLGEYMRALFVDRMRQAEARDRQRPRTEEVDIAIAETGQLSPAKLIAAERDRPDATPIPSRPSAPDMPTVPGTRRQLMPKPKRRWPIAVVAAAAAAVAAFVVMKTTSATEPNAGDSAAAASATTEAPAQAAPTPAPAPVTAIAPETPPATLQPVPAPAAPAVADDDDDKSDDKAETRKASRSKKAKRSRSRRAKKSTRNKTKSKKARVKKAESKPGRKDEPTSWQLDSPLPPPTN